jgi:hypothetical protein
MSVSNRVPFRWNLKSSAVLQQHYRRSRVHLSLQIDQEAMEMKKCDEEILLATVGLVALGITAPASAANCVWESSGSS